MARRPSRTDRPFDPNAPATFTDQDQYSPVRGELALWNYVILQALKDSQLTNKRPEPMVWKREELAWLVNYSDDFKTVCELAFLDPKETYRKISKFLEEQPDVPQRSPKRH